MICARCGNETDANDCAACGETALLNDRYRLDEVIGLRGSHKTYRAFDTDDERRVVVKELLLRGATSAKEIELFEREAELLMQIEHRSVPSFVDHFELRLGKQLGLFVVQAYVEGESLEAIIGRERLTEAEVANIIAEVLLILAHLKSRHVVHRDLKPSNILRDEAGRLHLVDFGAGRAVAESIYRAGSTVTGTFGYMAPEQMRAEAIPASDVYGLGATAVRLLTRREPGELVGDDGRIHWREGVEIDAGLAGLIDTVLAPDPAERPSDLEPLAEQLLDFATGRTSELREFRSTALQLASEQVTRPTVPVLAAQVVKHASRPFLSGSGLAAILIPAAAVDLEFFLGFWPITFSGIALAFVFFSDAARRTSRTFKRWNLMRSGFPSRAIVTNRAVRDSDFYIDYEFRVEGTMISGTHPVREELFMTLNAGDEIDIFFDPEPPHESAVVGAGVYEMSPPLLETDND